jgi:hypothetical protein
MKHDLEGTGGWEAYAEIADTAMHLAIAQQREVIVKWTNYVKPYNKHGELVPIQYFKFNPAMNALHVRGQYLNLQMKHEHRAVWPPLPSEEELAALPDDPPLEFPL